MIVRLFKVISFIFIFAIFILALSYIVMLNRENKSIEEVFPNNGKLIQTTDVKLYTRDYGNPTSKPVVLIHGTGSWGEIWNENIEALTLSGFRVITIDMPPFGFSEKLSDASSYKVTKQANRIIELLEKINVTDPIIICHSVGCRAVVETIILKPSFFSKAVLVDPALGFLSDKRNFAFEQNHPSKIENFIMQPGILRDSIISLYGTNPLSIKNIFNSFVFDKSSVTDKRLEMLKRPLVIKNITRAEGDWLQNLSIEADNSNYTDFNNLSKIHTPVFIIWGSEDTVTPVWQAYALQKLIPNSGLSFINHAGHIPYIENTDDFNKSVLEFIK